MRRAIVAAVFALLTCAAPVHAATTTVSIQFDDGRAQEAVRPILAKHHVHATFFVNTGYIGTEDYLTWKELHALAADGNEIGGHTLTHRDLATLSAGEQRREICGDRDALIAHGFKPTNFAYPFGSYTPLSEKIVQECGYASGRAAWGLWGSGCEEDPATCPYAIDPAHPGDPWALLTADAPIDLTYVENQRNVVRNAIAHGGGWVQLYWHVICPDDCDEYSWPPEWLDQLLTWLDAERAVGAIDIKTSQEVLAGAFHPAVRPPKPPAPPKGANRLRNASFERRKGGVPMCWEQQGDWSRVRGPHGHAAATEIAGSPDGFAAIAQPLDQGECSPAVTAGERLVLRGDYRSTDHPRFVVWKRSKAGGWSFWRDGRHLRKSHGFRRATWVLPRVPRGVSARGGGGAQSGGDRCAGGARSLVPAERHGDDRHRRGQQHAADQLACAGDEERHERCADQRGRGCRHGAGAPKRDGEQREAQQADEHHRLDERAQRRRLHAVDERDLRGRDAVRGGLAEHRGERGVADVPERVDDEQGDGDQPESRPAAGQQSQEPDGAGHEQRGADQLREARRLEAARMGGHGLEQLARIGAVDVLEHERDADAGGAGDERGRREPAPGAIGGGFHLGLLRSGVGCWRRRYGQGPGASSPVPAIRSHPLG
jgi:peptidoglycan/xylan/chitin deacetylase (PgdA/CDA1 family)